MIKWIVAGFFGVVIVIVLGMAFGMQVLNPGVMQELVEDPMGGASRAGDGNHSTRW